MKKKNYTNARWIIVASIAAVILAVLVSYAFITRPQASTTQQSTTNSTTSRFASLKGDAFDEAYLADMLAHHEGAVNMAEMIGPGTERAELREFGADIVAVQSKEMLQMQQWQKDWGYEATYGGHASHGGSSGNAMAGHMMDMGESLMGLRGAEFEKRFLELMIEHHQQAVDMSVYAEQNAEHQEVKDLARSIISTQSSEIDQMKRWLSAWGYSEMAS